MIGKPEWFCARKFGWGLGFRKKEGIAYLLAAGAIAFGIMLLPLPLGTRLIGVGALYAVLLADVLHIMFQVYSKLDERDQKHQALAERNAAFVAVALLVAYVAYETAIAVPEAVAGKLLFPVGMLLSMSVVKGATLLYLERKG